MASVSSPSTDSDNSFSSGPGAVMLASPLPEVKVPPSLADLMRQQMACNGGEYLVCIGGGCHPPLQGGGALGAAPKAGASTEAEGAALPREEYEALVGEYRAAAAAVDAVFLKQHEVCTPPPAPSPDRGNATARGETWTGFYLVRKNPPSVEAISEVRVAVVGNVDAGKSTMLGVLTSGLLDDGRGRSRIGMFRHKHEAECGRTSSIGQEVLAFDAAGRVVGATRNLASPAASLDSLDGRGPLSSLPSTDGVDGGASSVSSAASSPSSSMHQLSARPPGRSHASSAGSLHRRRANFDGITEEAHKIITFMDLAGHERYLKTTMFGLTGGAADYAMLMVGANAGLVGMAKEHLALAFALSMPVFVVVTKVDMCPEGVLEGTMRQIVRVLKAPTCRRTPMVIKTKDDLIFAVRNFTSQRICPVFQVSNVSGLHVDLLQRFLHLLPQGRRYGSPDAAAEFQITDSYMVSGVGTVVAGTVVAGTISIGQTVYLGPDSLGAFAPVAIKGVQRKRINVPSVYAGQCASFALKKIKRSTIRKGMVLLGKELACNPPPAAHACREFEAEVIILFHSTTISPRYQAMLHCGVVRQTVAVVSMQQDLLRTGDRARVRFRFVRAPEFLKVDARLVFREGRTKGVGRITALYGP